MNPHPAVTLSPRVDQSTPPLRVLVVDGNHDAADSLALVVTMLGHQTSTAYDGPTALQLARTSLPQIVLLDLALPKMDGYAVARGLREEIGLRNTLLVAVTGFGREEDRHRCQEAGFDHLMLKPLDLAELEKLLTGEWAKAV